MSMYVVPSTAVLEPNCGNPVLKEIIKKIGEGKRKDGFVVLKEEIALLEALLISKLTQLSLALLVNDGLGSGYTSSTSKLQIEWYQKREKKVTDH
jgi:hypothetical protein